MSLLDIAIPSRKVVIQQEFGEKKEVGLDVFGLNTEDLTYLVQKHGLVFAAYFLRNVTENVENKAGALELLGAFPQFSDDIVACGCKPREAAEHIASFVTRSIWTVLRPRSPDFKRTSRAHSIKITCHGCLLLFSEVQRFQGEAFLRDDLALKPTAFFP